MMKDMKKYIILAAAATVVLLGGCAKTESEYSPGPVDEGMGYYFAGDATNTTVDVNQDKLSCSVELLRAKVEGAASKTISVNDTSSIFFPSNSVTVDFPDKANKVKISFDIERDKLEIGKKYAIGFKIPSESTSYAPDSLTVIVNYPEPWQAFSKPGTFQDNYYFAGNGSWNVTVEQNGLYPNRYRVATPYKNLLGTLSANASDYLEFEILPKGSTLNGTEITEDGIVVFSECNIGYHHSSYDEDIVWIHVSDSFLRSIT